MKEKASCRNGSSVRLLVHCEEKRKDISSVCLFVCLFVFITSFFSTNLCYRDARMISFLTGQHQPRPQDLLLDDFQNGGSLGEDPGKGWVTWYKISKNLGGFYHVTF